MEAVVVFDDIPVIFEEIADRAGRFADLTPTIGEILVERVLDKFEEEGPGWMSLMPSTIAKRRTSESYKILQDRGVLVGSISKAYGPDFAQADTNVPYAIFHVYGTINMPRRDFLDIDLDAVQQEIAEMILHEVE